MPSSEKPPWITTLPGTPEAFKPLSQEEAEILALEAIEEAKKLGEGQGLRFLSDDQKLILDAERRREHHQKNAALHGPDEIQHRLWWAEAAIDLGKFEEARAALKKSGKIIDKGLSASIKELSKAISRPDDAECKCEREEVADEKGGVIALDRRYAVRRIFSPAHNQVVTLYRCRHCNFFNATTLTPERQAGLEVARKQNERQARLAVLNNSPHSKGTSDAILLKQ